MDVSHVHDRVAEIAKVARDDEAAHGAEDELHLAVLTYLAGHSTDPRARELAAEAIRTAEIRFERWCA